MNNKEVDYHHGQMKENAFHNTHPEHRHASIVDSGMLAKITRRRQNHLEQVFIPGHQTSPIGFYRPTYRVLDPDGSSKLIANEDAENIYGDPKERLEFHIHRDPLHVLTDVVFEYAGTDKRVYGRHFHVNLYFEDTDENTRHLLQSMQLDYTERLDPKPTDLTNKLFSMHFLFLLTGGGFPLSILKPSERFVLEFKSTFQGRTSTNGGIYKLHLTGKVPLDRPFDWDKVSEKPNKVAQLLASVNPRVPFQWNALNSYEFKLRHDNVGGRNVLNIPLSPLAGRHIVNMIIDYWGVENTLGPLHLDANEKSSTYNIQLKNNTMFFPQDMPIWHQHRLGHVHKRSDNTWSTVDSTDITYYSSTNNTLLNAETDFGDMAMAKMGSIHGGLILTGDEILVIRHPTGTFTADRMLRVGFLYWSQVRWDKVNRFVTSAPHDFRPSY